MELSYIEDVGNVELHLLEMAVELVVLTLASWKEVPQGSEFWSPMSDVQYGGSIPRCVHYLVNP
jgi:hypothetical protein